MITSDVLVLNSGFIPIRITSVREAICLIFSDKAIPVVEEDKYIKSPSISICIPSVISLIGYNLVPQRRVVFSRLSIIYRDDMTCQYCGKRFHMNDLTIDHVIPRSRWGKDVPLPGYNFISWKNLVCSCKWCNNRKGSKLLSELKWKLIREPYEPTYLPNLVITYNKAKAKEWLPFCKFNVRLIHTL